MPIDYAQLRTHLWSAADELRANSRLRSHEYSTPVLGLIFLRYADVKFGQVYDELKSQSAQQSSRRRQLRLFEQPARYQASGAFYLPNEARFSSLLNLPEGENIGQRINEAMRLIEQHNPQLKGVLPQSYHHLENPTLSTLLKTFNDIPMDIEGDAFGKIYEYFLGQFAKAEGQRGGEFFTPTSLVKLIVEVIEPFHGKILDPACGSGGMFVQSADFVKRHSSNGHGILSIYGQEKTEGTISLAKMNLAIHSLEGEIVQGNTYYEDLHRAVGQFDFVMANPPFNVNNVDKDRLKNDTARFPFGMPRADNANYLWMQIFYSALNSTGRAGFVMANSASDARQSELDIRKKLIEDKAVDVMIAIGSNFFLTVTLPCTLWFLDRGKAGTEREDTVLFIDARHIYRQVDRALRDFTEEQMAFIANIVRLYRNEKPEWPSDAGAQGGQGAAENETRNTQHESNNRQSEIVNRKSWDELFPNNTYTDIPGLCKVATLAEIEQQGYSLNPGRYVGVAERQADDFDFAERLEELNEELEILNVEARELEERIAENVVVILEGPQIDS